MKISVERDVFADRVAWVLRCVSARATLPVLGGVLFEATKDGVRLSGTDLEMVGESTLDARVEQPGRAVVPGRLLGEIARALPQGTVRIEADAAEARITCGSAEFTLRLLAADDLPQVTFSEGPGGTVAGGLFAAAVSQVTRAASTDEARPVLTGTLIEAGKASIMLVATDSYRLAVREIPWKGPKDEIKRVVPARALQEAARGADGDEEVTLRLAESQIVFEAPGRRLGSRLIEGEFPNWRTLLPDEQPNRLIADRETLIEAVRRVGILAQAGAAVRLELGTEGVLLAAGSQDVGAASERVEAKYEGEPLTIAFNPTYLVDGLQAVEGDEALLAMRDGLKPAILRPVEANGFQYLVMPVRPPGG